MNTTPTILVTGGTGKTGRRIVSRLDARGHGVRTGSRSARPPFDWDDDRTWAPALGGVAAAYIAFAPDLAFPGAADTVGRFARLAVERGVRRLVLLSGRGEPGAMRAEHAVEESGADWTIVRSSFFAQNFSEGAFADAVRRGVLAVPAGTVAEPFIDVDDVADVAVAALTDVRHAGRRYEVTGPRLLTFGDVAAELSAVVGRTVEYTPVSAEEFLAGLQASGMPDEEAVGLTELFVDVLDGRNASVVDGVERALGRQPNDFSAYVRAAAASGAWPAAQAA